jgi:hypothetical protein
VSPAIRARARDQPLGAVHGSHSCKEGSTLLLGLIAPSITVMLCIYLALV